MIYEAAKYVNVYGPYYKEENWNVTSSWILTTIKVSFTENGSPLFFNEELEVYDDIPEFLEFEELNYTMYPDEYIKLQCYLYDWYSNGHKSLIKPETKLLFKLNQL